MLFSFFFFHFVGFWKKSFGYGQWVQGRPLRMKAAQQVLPSKSALKFQQHREYYSLDFSGETKSKHPAHTASFMLFNRSGKLSFSTLINSCLGGSSRNLSLLLQFRCSSFFTLACCMVNLCKVSTIPVFQQHTKGKTECILYHVWYFYTGNPKYVWGKGSKI